MAGAQVEEPTRKASKAVMEALAPVLPSLIGGSADLTPSNLSRPDDLAELSRDNFGGRYIHFGIREHAMAAVTNGIALHKGFLPYCATFLCFVDYCRPAVRLSALMGQKVIYVLTHDTITQGQDGPTHQPVEHFAILRATPNCIELRPADANETVEAWKVALQNDDGPVALMLTRHMLFMRPADGVEVAECWELALEAKDQPVALIMTREAVPSVRTRGGAENLCRRGAYVLQEATGRARVTLLATGSEVSVAVEARRILEARGIATRVVSMPCLELFDRQTREFRRSILARDTLLVSIEAATTFGWDRYVGPDGLMIGLTTFGASGRPDEVMAHFGITPEAVAAAVMAKLESM